MEEITVRGVKIPVLVVDAAVVGSGAAGLNAADELFSRGASVAIVTDRLGAGTSFNAGSDKQTYYKLTLSGSEPDSIKDLADTFHKGGAMHGDIAYALAALSARSYFKLVQLGVPFPHNEWGEYMGYRTDHDPRQRATSAGPLTSRFMGTMLQKAVQEKNIPIYEGLQALDVLVDGGRAVGLLMIDEGNRYGQSGLLAVAAGSLIWCTGGAAGAYRDSVFPTQQTGAMGIPLLRGVAAENIDRWQFGLASTKVRWNLSGSYQQVLPRYVSTDENGGDAREFLDPWFASHGATLDAIFLKGYQWPFDARKVPGSSVVDLAVWAETSRGRRVFLDFMNNPAGGALAWAQVGKEAKAYLDNCGCSQDTPFARLWHMNPDAVLFYRNHGIDIETELLEIAVCAQHTNGGLGIDAWWRTSLPGLYAAGETAGAFGVYRPGGSALNETQCGSLRAAMHIAAHPVKAPSLPPSCLEASLAWAQMVTSGGGTDDWDAAAMLNAARGRMSDQAAHIRRPAHFERLLADTAADFDTIQKAPKDPQPLCVAAQLREVLACHAAMLSAFAEAEKASPDGGALSCPGMPAPGVLPAARFLAAPQVMRTVLNARDGLSASTQAVAPRPMPEGGGWFETVWRDYREGRVFGD